MGLGPLSSNPALKERFEREARAISSLNHPRMCILHDVGHQDGVDFLVMEYLQGVGPSFAGAGRSRHSGRDARATSDSTLMSRTQDPPPNDCELRNSSL